MRTLYHQLIETNLYQPVLTMLNIFEDNPVIRNAFCELPPLKKGFTIKDVMVAYYNAELEKITNW